MKHLLSVGVARGTARVPGSKSFTNRALVCAALASGESKLHDASDADDTRLMRNGLDQLGIGIREAGGDLLVSGKGGRLFAPKFPIPVGNAGTTFRFLLAAAALADGPVTLEGDERMAERPNEELLDALGALGVDVRQSAPGARYTVAGGGIRGGAVTLSAARSSQFLSAILMVAPCAREDVFVRTRGQVSSRAYAEMTLDVMRHFAVIVEGGVDGELIVRSGQRYRPSQFNVEPDVSSATYPWAAAAITGGPVTVRGTTLSSRQADIGFLGVLQKMGAVVEGSPEGVRVAAAGPLRGVDVDMNGMPDAVPTVAAVALFAQGPTRIRNIGHLRHKESDRLEGFAGELRKLGANVVVQEEGLEIHPGALHAAELSTLNDHRLAMSFALVGLKVPGVTIDNAACVSKSFPRFWQEMEALQT